ncbi:MAG: hypothetical protein ACRC06_06640, partial [Waterburya sp.]
MNISKPYKAVNLLWAITWGGLNFWQKFALTIFSSHINDQDKTMTNPQPSTTPSVQLSPDAPVEYIVIGSGAGGGPLACNLAKAGHKVVLMEAGDDDPQTDFPAKVPFFGARIADDQRISWGYFVRHYANDKKQHRDPNYDPKKDGVWYPRVGALGGCTIHSLMVEMYPSNSDWDYIADITKDPTWKAENMRKY